MKKVFIVALLSAFVCLNLGAIAQPPPPPNNPSQSGSGNPPVGGSGAKLGSGMDLLFVLAGLYGGRKIYTTRQENKNKE